MKKTRMTNSTTRCEAPTVVIIGCGPAGISFLHAVALRKQKMEDEGDLEGLAKLPIVTSFERAPEPGGVWRSQRESVNDLVVSKSLVESVTDESSSDDSSTDNSSTDDSHTDGDSSRPTKDYSVVEEVASIIPEKYDDQTVCGAASCPSSLEKKAVTVEPAHKITNMYEALWTNAPKEGIEFFDYTFEDHFKHPLPVYMPRQFLLEYMLERVTRNNPNIFSDNVRFNTQVNYVCYNETTKKFETTIVDIVSNEKTTLYFDKCIWGGGINGNQKVPRSMRNLLRKQKYLGNTMHSSTAGNYLDQVKGGRILLVGDAFSAEDLALQSVKMGAEKVYVLSRSGEGLCNDTAAWPGNKVEALNNLRLTGVIQGGNGLRFSETKFDVKRWKQNLVSGGETVDLENISTVIYCTGYDMNFSMLDPLLTFPFVEYAEESFPVENTLVYWEMAKNSLTEVLDNDIEPLTHLCTDHVGVIPHMYRGIVMSNPNMMFIQEYSNMPLFEIDVRAWFLLNHILGDFKLPNVEEVERLHTEIVMEGMDLPSMRYVMDMNYKAEYKKIEKDHWAHTYHDPRCRKIEEEASRLQIRGIAHEIKDGAYPLDIGTREKLNKKGELLVSMAHESHYGRTQLDPKSEDKEWRTFRDTDPSHFVSIHTGNVAVHLKERWIDLDDNDPNILNA